MKKLFTGVSVNTLVPLMRRGTADCFLGVVQAKVMKACDGRGVFKDLEFSIQSVEPESYGGIYDWILENKGTIVWRSGGATTSTGHQRMIVVFRDGIADISRSSGTRPTVQRYGSRVRAPRRMSRSSQVPNSIDLSFEFSGLEDWVDSSEVSLKALFDRKVARPTRKVEKKLHVLNFTKKGIGLNAIAQFDDALERGNYTEKVLWQFDEAVREISSKDPSGRLLIIHGPPGTGKTFMVRSMINAIKGTQCILVPSQYVPEFTKPALGNYLIRRRKPTCLIIEDADELLVKRMADNMSAINAMLNLSDGMFGMVADIRLICTTNARRLEIDPALVRSGRLLDLDQIHIDKLTEKHAGEVFNRLTGEKVSGLKSETTLADVYKLARNVGDK